MHNCEYTAYGCRFQRPTENRSRAQSNYLNIILIRWYKGQIVRAANARDIFYIAELNYMMNTSREHHQHYLVVHLQTNDGVAKITISQIDLLERRRRRHSRFCAANVISPSAPAAAPLGSHMQIDYPAAHPMPHAFVVSRRHT